MSFSGVSGSSKQVLVLFMVVLLVTGMVGGPLLSAKSKDKNKDSGDSAGQEASQEAGQAPQESPSPVTVSSDGSLSMDFGLSWADAGTGGGTDWVASASPGASIQGNGSLDISSRDLPWLSAGAMWHGELNISLDSKSPATNEPYMVIKDLDMEARMALYLRLLIKTEGFELSFRPSLDGGVRVLDLNDADYFYQPLGSSGEDFWFRVLPLLGSGQKLKVKIAKIMDVSLENQVLAWWDAETAYGRNWNPGFDDTLKGSIDFMLVKDKDFRWTLGAGGKSTWNSRVVIPGARADIGLKTGFEFDKASLRLDVLAYHYEAAMANFDPALASDVLNQVYSQIEFKTSLGGASWGLALSWPWQAWGADTSTPAAGQWEVKCSVSL